MSRLCVFCGSSSGVDPAYAEAARVLAEVLVARNVGLVYGGAHRGLMGIVADGVLARGGEVIGVIPRFLVDKEIAHTRLSQLIVVDSMHERKAEMAKLAHAFVALPGGFGTLEEWTEVLTWRQLELHDKPIGILNTAGYYDGLLALAQHMTRSGFVPQPLLEAIHVAQDPAEVVDRLLGTAGISTT